MISDFYRYNHLQKIEQQINQSIMQLGVHEEEFTTGVLKHATELGTRVVNNVLEAPMLNKRAIDTVIKYPWHGANYSDRIWNNKAELIASMKSELTNGIIQGKSIYQVANMMEDRLNVGKSKTQRLVRTEYMHALNQGQIESYKAAGYTKLRWSATMDDRTSDICRKRNGKEYPIDQLPDIPAHPNCRCTFVPVIDDDFIDARARMLEEAKQQIENAEPDEEFLEIDNLLERKLQTKSDSWYSRLSNPQIRAIDNFTDDWYNDMNGLLMDKNYDSSDNDYVYFNIERLEEALSQFSLEEDIVVYRGISSAEYDSILKGNVFQEFKSTSTAKHIATEFAGKSNGKVVKIKLPKGSDGAFVGENSAVPDEKEFILNRGTMYEAKEVDGHLEVTIIGNEKQELPSYDFDDDEY